MATRRKASSGRRVSIGVEAVLTLVVLLVALGWFIRSHPLMLDPKPSEERVAEAGEGDPGADVLVVLPTVPEAHSLESLSFDQAWLNVVEREVGPFRTVDGSQLTRSVMDPCAWVIIPRRAAAQLDPTQTQFVRNWVEDGGTVILEQPEGPWRGLIGQAIASARVRETRRITSFDGALSRGEMRADILEMPRRTSVVPYNTTDLTRGRDYQVLLEVDGLPGVVSLHIGRGRVILLLFDFGRAAVQLMQGLPNGDFSVQRGADSLLPEGGVSTADLIADPSLRTSEIPFVDLLERNLLYLADVHRPIGRLWAYPGTSRGALLVGHSEALYGSAAAYMADWEHANEQRSSMFVVAGSMTPESLARIGRVDVDVELQWVPESHPGVPSRDWGVRNFHPVRRAMGILEQFDRLNADLAPYGPVVATRSLDGLWTAGYFDGFRTLEAGGIQLDSSYGPAPAWLDPTGEQFGYVFATGRPYRPIDRNGYRFDLHELPIAINASSGGYSLSRVRSLIIDSSEGYHTTIAADWRPDVMATRPSVDAIEGWQQAFEMAESQELWVTTYAEYAEFLGRRQGSHVDSTFSREERRLTIEVRIVGPDVRGEDDEAISPSVAFPVRFEGRPVERLMVDSELTPTSALGLTGDRVLHILPLTGGEHRVQVIYGSPVEAVPQ